MRIWMDILSGAHDDDLDKIVEAVAGRRKLLNPIQNSFELAKGDRIRIRNNARPKYLVGMTGTVTGHEGTKILIKFDHAVGRFGNGITRCPVDLVERTSAN